MTPDEIKALIETLKCGLDALRAEASRGPVTGRRIFAMTDPLMDAISRSPTDAAAAPDLAALALRQAEEIERLREQIATARAETAGEKEGRR